MPKAADAYTHLGPFSDLVAACRRAHQVFPLAKPGRKTQKLVREALAFAPGREHAAAVRVERTWRKDGIAGEEISWSVGYGPRTKAWLLKPAGHKGKLPGVVALHDHGAFKWFGKEKIADGPDQTHPILENFRRECYDGRAWANELARRGFAVLVPDVFLWGSRGFPRETMGAGWGGTSAAPAKRGDSAQEIAGYNAAAGHFENLVAKYCTVLGTSLPGLISFEDRIAVDYLARRKDVDARAIGCAGLSGGGLRAALLQATCERIRATVVVGLMSTFESLLDRNVASHTWMMFPPGWGRNGDWSDLAACRAPSPLLVQYNDSDQLFPLRGQKAAHRRIAGHYRSVGKPRNYVGQFYPGLHKFDIPMQEDAFAWLAARLKRA